MTRPFSFSTSSPRAIEQSKRVVPVAAEYPLAEAAKAHERLAAGHVLGKIVLRVQPA